MKINNLILEKNFQLNHLFLKIILFLSFVIISINFYEWVLEKSYYEYSDWLINYQGGFTRRGLNAVSYTHLRANDTGRNVLCRLGLVKK